MVGDENHNTQHTKPITHIKFSGEDIVEVTPVPIPNTEVKLNEADNSWGTPPVKIGIRQIFLFIPL